MEIGVARGRSSYFMCAILTRNNPNLSYKMVDIKDSLDHFDRFHEILPNIEKCIPSTSDDFQGEQFDFVFIDGDHSYDAVMNDWNNVGQYAKVVAFHDVYAHEYDKYNGGVCKAWQTILARTQARMHQIYTCYPERWMGIGCIVNVKPESVKINF